MNVVGPCKREEFLLVQHVGTETLVYDEQKHQAYCLNPVSSLVWDLCDGQHSVQQIAGKVSISLQYPVDEAVVLFAIGQLRKDGLLLAEAAETLPPALTRRELTRKLGFGVAALLPAVTMVLAPKAAQAYGGNGSCMGSCPTSEALRSEQRNRQ